MKSFRLPRWRFMNCCGHSVGHDAPLTATTTDGASP